MSLISRHARERANAGDVITADGSKRGTYSSLEIEKVGIMGEIAVARFYGTDPDLEVYKERKEGAEDLVRNGQTANIKSTKYFNRPSLLVADYDNRYDIYLLCSVNLFSGYARLQGYATREEIRSKPRERFREGSRMSKVVPYEELHPIKFKGV
jgi:hypothetical protein